MGAYQAVIPVLMAGLNFVSARRSRVSARGTPTATLAIAPPLADEASATPSKAIATAKAAATRGALG